MEPAPYIYVADVVDVVSYNLFNEEVQRRGSTRIPPGGETDVSAVNVYVVDAVGCRQ